MRRLEMRYVRADGTPLAPAVHVRRVVVGVLVVSALLAAGYGLAEDRDSPSSASTILTADGHIIALQVDPSGSG